LKAADFVGHPYGPDSPEMRETLAEQDRQLARILEALEKKAGANRVVVVITAESRHASGTTGASEETLQ
jgi:predicted AlkP superfamily pyrophosphatase or phosphodiesterase